MDRSVIRAERLTLDYRAKRVLSDVSMSIGRGRIVALVGPSGCGKTSFLSCLNRMTDQIAGARVSGSLRFEGEDVLSSSCDLVRLRRRIAMIGSRPNALPFSIERNLEFPLREHGMFAEGVVEAALRWVGLWSEVKDRLHAPALSLSDEQQQRLCIARALALRPEVLLFDEPCSTLEDLMASLRRHLTLVVTTRSAAQAERIADDVTAFGLVRG